MSRNGRFGEAVGCLYAVWVAGATSLLLVFNGSLTLLIIRSLADAGHAWADRADVAQLLLLTTPVLLVVAEWKLVDRLSRLLNLGRTH